jgi:hypothetical protein
MIINVKVYTFAGTNLLPGLESPICVFTSSQTNGSTVAILTVAEDRETATCQSSFSSSRDVIVNIMYSTPKYPTNDYPSVEDYDRPEYFVGKLNGELRVIVHARAPVPTSAIFDPTGAAIYFDFSSPISVIADKPAFINSGIISIISFTSPVPCSTIFVNPFNEDEQLWRGGSESDCTVTKLSPGRLKLNFDGDFTLDPSASPIIPDKIITLIPNAIVAFGALYSTSSTGSITVSEPSVKPPSFVVVTAPSLIGECIDFEMDLSSSYGSAGRKWKSVEIEFTSNGTVSGVAAVLAKNEMVMGNLTEQSGSVVAGTSTSVILGREILVEDDYVFTVKFTNFLGGSGKSLVFLNNRFKDCKSTKD